MHDDDVPIDTRRNGAMSRRHVLAGGALIAASAVAFARQPTSKLPRLPAGRIEAMMPRHVAGWTFESSSGLVLPPPDSLSDRLYDEIVTRVYTGPDLPPVMLLIAYSNLQDGMLQVHRPEVCYPVGGFRLSDSRIVNVPVLPGFEVPCRYFSAESVARTEQVLYWTRIGADLPGRWVEQRWSVVEANLRGDVPDGVLVRFSAVEADAAEGLELLKQFSATFIATLPVTARKLLIGR